MNKLTYNGTDIRDRDEILCLTDMWKAAGSHEEQRPAQWARHTEGRVFIEYVAASLNLTAEQVYNVSRGRHGGTWAHWQISLAYAKYLSPEFHMWANSVVRAHMENQHALGEKPASASQISEIVKAVVTTLLNPVEHELGDLSQHVAGMIPIADPRLRAVPNRMTVREALDRAGARTTGRRSLHSRISHALRKLARQRNLPVYPMPHVASTTLLFPVDLVNEFMAGVGDRWVAEHNTDQPVLQYPLPFPPRPGQELRV
jgi:KilA-N domain